LLKVDCFISVLCFVAASFAQNIDLSDFLKAEGIEDAQVIDNYASQYATLINTLKQEFGDNISVNKQHKIIYKFLHENYFKKYSFIPFLSIIFDIKHYNYLTATILYALITEALGHSYQLYMTPAHVYLIVYDPAGKEIYIDLSDYRLGFDSIDDRNAILKILLLHHLITEEQAKVGNPDDLLSDYLQTASPITINDLLPLYYTHMALSHESAKRYQDAYENIESAFRINSQLTSVHDNFISLWTSYRNFLFKSEQYDDLDSLLINTSDLLRVSETFHFVYVEFLKTYEIFLINEKQNLNRAMALLISVSPFFNQETIAEIEQLVYGQKVKELLADNEYEAAFNAIKELYIVYPQVVEITSLFLTACQNFIGELVNAGDYKAATRRLDSLLLVKPDDTLIRQLYANILVSELSRNRAQYIANPVAAESLMVVAHTMDTSNISIKQSLVYLYHTRAMQLTRENDLENARNEIEKGLIIDPENRELLEDLRLLNEQLSP
jgi:tetratricopeptide (TPR) repeat protein